MEQEKKKLEVDLLETKKWETTEDWWNDIMDAYKGGEGSANEVEYLFLHRPDLKKMPGEDEFEGWLEKKLGRKPLVKINEKGILAPIETEEKL
ncbi:MAG: hypothetical protein ABSA74_03790 [Candidatus Staskawiczbacteria bacterium]|jgi:hypothetical protein